MYFVWCVGGGGMGKCTDWLMLVAHCTDCGCCDRYKWYEGIVAFSPISGTSIKVWKRILDWIDVSVLFYGQQQCGNHPKILERRRTNLWSTSLSQRARGKGTKAEKKFSQDHHHHYVPSVVNRSAVMDLHRSRSRATLIQSLYDIFVHSLMSRYIDKFLKHCTLYWFYTDLYFWHLDWPL